MPKCPQCNKDLPTITRQCRFCKADLDLLVDYVNKLDNGVEKAEELTRSGELDKAVWTYLEVLEIDPNNAAARKQVSKIATAVRHFDSVSPTRRWLTGATNQGSALLRLLRIGVMCVVIVLAFGAGFLVGVGTGTSGGNGDPQKQLPGGSNPSESATGK